MQSLMGRQDVEHNLVSQHVEWDWKEENKCDVAFTAASYECVHVNKSWRDGRSRWSSCCLRFHTIDALLGLSVCVQQSDGQVHETHETTRTQIGWFQPWFYLCFGCPQDIHTKKNKRERQTKEHAPTRVPRASGHRCQNNFLWLGIHTDMSGVETGEWKHKMEVSHDGRWAMQNWEEHVIGQMQSRWLALSLLIWALPVKLTYLQVPVKRIRLSSEQRLATMICKLIFGLV